MQKFNINNYVKVRLTPHGRVIHKEYWTPFSFGNYRTPEVDEDGYSQFQMHDLMQVFGNHIGMGLALPFEIEILLELGS